MAIFRTDLNGAEFVAECSKKLTRAGFAHVVRLYANGEQIAEKRVKYYNRTWESFEFKNALSKVLDALERADRMTAAALRLAWRV